MSSTTRPRSNKSASAELGAREGEVIFKSNPVKSNPFKLNSLAALALGAQRSADKSDIVDAARKFLRVEKKRQCESGHRGASDCQYRIRAGRAHQVPDWDRTTEAIGGAGRRQRWSEHDSSEHDNGGVCHRERKDDDSDSLFQEKHNTGKFDDEQTCGDEANRQCDFFGAYSHRRR